ncbi:MAG: carbon-nitrogen hydrolase family protein [Pseudomonadota bacterium]
MSVRVAAVQMRSTADPSQNAAVAAERVAEAAERGATYIQTPEVTNLVQMRRPLAAPLVQHPDADETLSALREVAAKNRVTVHIGSLVVREGEHWRNRAHIIGPTGDVVATYDKIHMFDVDLPSGERFRESNTYTPGKDTVICHVGDLAIGVSICFDLRFPALYAALSAAGANVLTAPSAFAKTTGAAHWHALLRARAIENGAFLIAAAQEGTHEDGRTTYGHSIIIDPWGRVLAEADETPGVIVADIDPADAQTVRAQIPVLTARRDIAPPQRAHAKIVAQEEPTL